MPLALGIFSSYVEAGEELSQCLSEEAMAREKHLQNHRQSFQVLTKCLRKLIESETEA